jgi:hypothetical protein
MKFFVLILVSLLPTAQMPAGEGWPGGLEDWSDGQGRQLRGTLVRVRGTQVRLALQDGTLRLIPLERFGAADQRRILEWMVHHPAALEYEFEMGLARLPDGSARLRVTNRGANTLEDLRLQARPAGPESVSWPDQALSRMEPGQTQSLTLPAGHSNQVMIRLCRGPAVVWEWSPPGERRPAWPLEPGQVRIPPTGLPPASVVAALLPPGSGSGRLGLPGFVGEAGKNEAASVEGEDLEKLFESP